jgi:hypothetical protein
MANPDYGTASMLNTGNVSFSPTTAPLTFPTQLFNTKSTPQTVTLTNAGKTTIAFKSIKSSEPFQMVDNCSHALAVGEKCAISVTFSAKSQGNYTGLVTILDSASSKPQFVALSGASTVAKVSPSSLNFGDEKVGSKSGPQTIIATNKSNASMKFAEIYFGGADENDFSETTNCLAVPILPGANCTVSVTFDPRKSGQRSAQIYLVLASGYVSPAPVALSGIGQ